MGTGQRVERINPEIAKFLKRKGISLEVQDTVSTCIGMGGVSIVSEWAELVGVLPSEIIV